MRTTMDKAGRIVVPKALRDQIGLVPGEVEVVADGAGLRVDVVFESNLVLDESGHYVFRDGGPQMTEEEFREFRLADQR